MKKVRVIMSLMAFMFAFVAAVAFSPKDNELETVYRENPTQGPCVSQTICTLEDPGVACGFQVLDSNCSEITRYKPM